MSDKHEAARAAFEAALASTSPGTASPGNESSGTESAGTESAGAASSSTGRSAPQDGPGRPRSRRRRKTAPGDPEQDLQTRDAEPDPYDVARQIVLRQLAMAPRSRRQLEDKLRQRSCPDDVAAAVLDRMTEVGLVDDVAYAEMLVRSKQAERGLARRALAQELRTKGIDPDIAADTLDGIDEGDERVRARLLVDKKLRSMHGLGVEVQTRRLAGMLARKGYSSGMSYAVIRDAIADSEEYLTD